MPIVIALLLSLLFSLPTTAAPSLVVLVRHAEKGEGRNPDLTPAGKRRAEALADALAQAGIRHVLSSDQLRTQATAAPLAARLGLQTEPVGFGPGGVAAHVKALAERVRALDGAVLVVGHSNTVPELVAELGAPRPVAPCETSFGLAWVLQLQPGAAPRVLSLRYGEPDPAGGPDCR